MILLDLLLAFTFLQLYAPLHYFESFLIHYFNVKESFTILFNSKWLAVQNIYPNLYPAPQIIM